MLQKQLSVAEAADLIGVSKSWLNKRRVYGGGPAYRKIAGRIVYDPADLAAYLDAHRMHNTSQTPGAAQADGLRGAETLAPIVGRA